MRFLKERKEDRQAVMENKTIKEVAADFFRVIINGIAKNSSKGYALIVIHGIKKSLAKEFPFVRLVHTTENSIDVDDKINSVDPHKVGKLFVRIINLLGPNLLKLLIKKELDQGNLEYLNKMGVKF